MRKLMLIAATAVSLATTVGHAGEIAKGKVCDYRNSPWDPNQVGHDERTFNGTAYDGCRSIDGAMQTGFNEGKVLIMDTTHRPNMSNECVRGREMQVLIREANKPQTWGGAYWVFPWSLNCP